MKKNRNQDFLILGTIITIAIFIRILLIPHVIWRFNGDDYLTGVFTVNILNGYQSLYYGHHNGTLASYLIAPLISSFGASLPVLIMLPIILTIILIISLYGLGRAFWGFWGGFAAACWLMLPSSTAMLWTLKPQPGYLEAITLATLTLWLVVHLLRRKRKAKSEIMLMASIALMATLAVWASYIIASLVVTTFVIALLSWQRTLQLPRSGYLLLVIIPLLLWFIPLILYTLLFPGNNPLWYVLRAPRPAGANPITAVLGFLHISLPMLLGAKHSLVQNPLSRTVTFLLMTLFIGSFLYTVIQAVYYRSQAAIIVLALALSTIALFVLSSFGYLFEDVRYVLPLYVVIPLVFASMVVGIRRLPQGQWWATLFLLVVLVTNGISTFSGVSLGIPYTPRNEAILTQELAQKDIRYIHTSYWIGMPVMFESGGQIVSSSIVGPTNESYDERNEERVLNANGEATAFIFRENGIATPDFESYLEQHNIQCQRDLILYYLVYTTCTPFPDVYDLELPEGME